VPQDSNWCRQLLDCVETVALHFFACFFLDLVEVQAASFSSSCASLELLGLAQGPSLNALAQDMSPAGAEAASMALPNAAGDGTYMFALF
jgi:hypothetical protein